MRVALERQYTSNIVCTWIRVAWFAFSKRDSGFNFAFAFSIQVSRRFSWHVLCVHRCRLCTHMHTCHLSFFCIQYCFDGVHDWDSIWMFHWTTLSLLHLYPPIKSLRDSCNTFWLVLIQGARWAILCYAQRSTLWEMCVTFAHHNFTILEAAFGPAMILHQRSIARNAQSSAPAALYVCVPVMCCDVLCACVIFVYGTMNEFLMTHILGRAGRSCSQSHWWVVCLSWSEGYL